MNKLFIDVYISPTKHNNNYIYTNEPVQKYHFLDFLQIPMLIRKCKYQMYL